MKRLLLCLVIALSLVGVLGPVQARQGSGNPLYEPAQVMESEVLSVRPHDSSARTQGLLYYNGFLYESTGTKGESMVRRLDPTTGDVLQSIDLSPDYYGEGLARVGDKLIQLTWQEQVAFIYDINTFEQVGTYEYQGEGWGLCTDGRFLYLSDGTPFLDVRDINTFELIFSGLVTVEGGFVERVNELECVGDYIYANVWKTNYIVKIDKTNGVVVGVIDCTNLLTEEERSRLDAESVLNGIAYVPETDTFLITGKYWPKMFEVRFVVRE